MNYRRSHFPLSFLLEIHLAFKILGQYLSLDIFGYQSLFFFLISIINSFVIYFLVTSFHQDFLNLVLIVFFSF
jgi:hypothetical protein